MRRVGMVFLMMLILVVFATGCGTTEASKSVSMEADKIIMEYRDYLQKLDTRDFNSISKAIDKFYQIKSEDKAINDDLFRYFGHFYNEVIENYNNTLASEQGDREGTGEKISALDKKMLEKNGIVAVGGEAGTYLFEKSYFVTSKFGDYLTDEVKQYLELDAEACKLRGEGYMYEDNLLTLTWDQVADLIVKYEVYVNKYPKCDIETSSAYSDLEFYLYLFTQCLDTTTFSYESGEIDSDSELRDSYTRFIEKYPQSKYQPILKGYFEVLKNNGFELDEEARQYLIKNGIRVMK